MSLDRGAGSPVTGITEPEKVEDEGEEEKRRAGGKTRWATRFRLRFATESGGGGAREERTPEPRRSRSQLPMIGLPSEMIPSGLTRTVPQLSGGLATPARWNGNVAAERSAPTPTSETTAASLQCTERRESKEHMSVPPSAAPGNHQPHRPSSSSSSSSPSALYGGGNSPVVSPSPSPSVSAPLSSTRGFRGSIRTPSSAADAACCRAFRWERL